jgi:site-specific recombinase XerD
MCPVYTETIKQIIWEGDVRKMWASAKYEYERTLLSVLWFSGGRPSEILELRRRDVNWGIADDSSDFFEMKLKTKKLERAVGFVVNERILRSSRPMGTHANIYIESIVKACRSLKPDDWVITYRSRMSINRIMHRLSAVVKDSNGHPHVWSAYHFRHSVFTHLARNGANLSTLKYWKGASDIGSVQRYIQATPVYIQIENQNRERDLMAGPRQNKPERYSAQVIERKATEEEIKKLPTIEEDK